MIQICPTLTQYYFSLFYHSHASVIQLDVDYCNPLKIDVVHYVLLNVNVMVHCFNVTHWSVLWPDKMSMWLSVTHLKDKEGHSDPLNIDVLLCDSQNGMLMYVVTHWMLMMIIVTPYSFGKLLIQHTDPCILFSLPSEQIGDLLRDFLNNILLMQLEQRLQATCKEIIKNCYLILPC